jgi:putative addiction module killer protein
LVVASLNTESISDPGYRVYFGKDGDTVVILLGGGTKKRQRRDIVTAQDRWKAYKQRKSQER